MRDDGQATGAGTPLDHGTGTDGGSVEAPAVPGPHGRWPSWVLVAAGVVPPLLLAETARRVLTGDYDEEFYGGYPSGTGAFDGAQPEITTGRRFGVLWALVDAPAPLWGGVVAALLLLAVVLTGRPAWLVPDRWGRRVAAGGAWLSSALALGALLGVVQHASAPSDERGAGALRFFLRTGLPSDLPGVVGALAVLLPALVVPALAGTVVWRDPGPAPGADPPVDRAGPQPVAQPEPHPEPHAESHADLHPEPPSGPRPAEERTPAPPEPPAPLGPPVVPESQRHLYRRPER